MELTKRPLTDLEIYIFLTVAFKKYLFIFWLWWVFIAAHGHSLVAVSGACSVGVRASPGGAQALDAQASEVLALRL